MRSLAVLVLLGLCALGCATGGNLFLLVPDPEGNVGVITIENEQGSQTLSGASESVTVASAQKAPEAPALLSQEDTQRNFGEVMAIEPPLPAKFLLYFESGTEELTAESLQGLDSVEGEAKARVSRDISVNGHADRSGDDQLNIALSLRRAEKVRALLEERGIDAGYLSVNSHGEGNPVVPTEDGVAEPLNRRVEVIIR